MSKQKFTYTFKLSITKKEIRKFGHFNWPELIMNDKIDQAVYQAACGVISRGEAGPSFDTCVIFELVNSKAITLNDYGRRFIKLLT